VNSKWHLYISWVKSAIRLFGAVYFLFTFNFVVFVVCVAIAELFGFVEEIKDNR